MLFDFAAQTGLEGERLAQLNRLEFNLDLALAGEPPGQPVFVRLAGEQARRPWPEGSLAALVDAARARVTRSGSSPGHRPEVADRRLAAALATPLLAHPPPPELLGLAAGMLRLRRVQDRRARRAAEVERWARQQSGGGDPGETLVEECARLRRLLADAPAAVAAVPAPWRPAVRFLGLAAERLVHRIERSPAGGGPASLGALVRVGLLLRARLGW